MPFTIQWTAPLGPDMTSRESELDAIKAATEMLGQGYTEILIVDEGPDGKAYTLAEFAEFYKTARE
jgi:hypothetical protein